MVVMMFARCAVGGTGKKVEKSPVAIGHERGTATAAAAT